MHRLSRALAALFPLLLPACDLATSPAPPAAVGAITVGAFIDMDRNDVLGPGDSALAGLAVEVTDGGSGSTTGVTGADGAIVFPDLAPGEYTVQIDSTSLDPAVRSRIVAAAVSRIVSVAADRETRAAFPFHHRSGVVRGRLVEDLDRNGALTPESDTLPAAGLRVVLFRDGAALDSVISDATGEWLFPSLEPGGYEVVARPGAAWVAGMGAAAAVELPPGGHSEVMLLLYRAVVPIAEVRSLGIGARVTVRGVVTAGADAFGEPWVQVQDSTGGVRAVLPATAAPSRGSRVEAVGTVTFSSEPALLLDSLATTGSAPLFAPVPLEPDLFRAGDLDGVLASLDTFFVTGTERADGGLLIRGAARNGTEVAALIVQMQGVDTLGLSKGSEFAIAGVVSHVTLGDSAARVLWLRDRLDLKRHDVAAIAFTSLRGGNGEIYVMKADGTGLLNLTRHPAFDGTPVWSPDGSRIAFTSSRAGNADVWLMDADGSGLVNLTNTPLDEGGPAWSPDGSRIAYGRDGVDPDQPLDQTLYVIDVQTRDTARLTSGRIDSEPDWSPDGSRIAFEGCCPPVIYSVASDGTDLRQLTSLDQPLPIAAPSTGPSYHPSGELISYAYSPDGSGETYGIWVMQADGSNPTALTAGNWADYQPDWSPDGLHIVFWSDREGSTDIYLMASDGSGLRRLTTDPAFDLDPAWRP